MPGQELRELRRQRNLTLKEVEIRSRSIAASQENNEYIFTAGRLSQVENSTSLPSLYKIATLSQVYGVSYGELLRIYGVALSSDWSVLRRGAGNRDLEAPAPVWA